MTRTLHNTETRRTLGQDCRLNREDGRTLQELLATVAVIVLIATMVLPLYFHYEAKARHTEVKANLGGIHVAEMAFYGEHLRFGSFEETGFALRGDYNRYAYRSPANGGVGPSTDTPGVDLLTPSNGAEWPESDVVPSGGTQWGPLTVAGFTVTAVSNIDSDAALDQWHINDQAEGLEHPDSDDAYL